MTIKAVMDVQLKLAPISLILLQVGHLEGVLHHHGVSASIAIWHHPLWESHGEHLGLHEHTRGRLLHLLLPIIPDHELLPTIGLR